MYAWWSKTESGRMGSTCEACIGQDDLQIALQAADAVPGTGLSDGLLGPAKQVVLLLDSLCKHTKPCEIWVCSNKVWFTMHMQAKFVLLLLPYRL